MTRTTIVADDRVIDRLRELARDRGVSLAEVIREALDQKAAEFRPKPLSIGIVDSGGSDVAREEATERVPPRSWR